MQTLQFGNNLLQLKQSRTSQLPVRRSINNWLVISPRQVILNGMLLTANFNIQNAHQHLSINFHIKSFLEGQQIPFVQIFPQKGNIMRGQIKKVRIKFAKQFKPEINHNGSMRLKVYVNLNTEWNKQYMITNRLRGWSQIKDLPIQEYQVPILISDQYFDIKKNIRNSVMFQSQFAKVSQDFSSFYGEEKFQVPEIDVYSKNHFHKINQKQKYAESRQSLDRKSISHSEKKGSKLSMNGGREVKQVYFGNGPRMVQSKLKNEYQLKKSRAESVKQKYNSPAKIKNAFQVKSPKVTIGINNPFSNNPLSSNPVLFQQYSDRKLPQKQNIGFENSIDSRQDSSISILRSLQGRNSKVKRYDFEHNESQYRKNNSHTEEEPVFKDFSSADHHFKTVDHHFNEQPTYQPNKRSIEIIVLAIIAGFFVALGSNFAKLWD